MRRSRIPLLAVWALGLVALIAWRWLVPVAPPDAVEPLPARARLPPADRDPQALLRGLAADVRPPPVPPRDAPGPPVPIAAAPREDGSASHRFFARNAEQAEKTVDRFCDTSKRLTKAGLGPRPDAKPVRDAATYLMVRVDWEDPRRPPGLLHLPEPLRQRLASYGTDWPAKLTDADLAGLDFSWLDALAQFDHWQVLGDGSIPNLEGAEEWARLRFAAALRDGDFAAASAQIRHLVALLHTTGLLIAEATAVDLLGLEATAFEAAKARGLDVGAWQPHAPADLSDYRRTAFAAPGLLFPGVDPAIAKKALACAANPCMAIFEATGPHAARGHLAPVDTTAAFTALADAAGCDVRALTWLRRHAADAGR